jgi:hemerythrin-like metal-binding protein
MRTDAQQCTWREEHSVHVEDMDVQHRRLVDFVDELRIALKRNRPRRSVSGILGNLVQFVYIHFADEEQFMRAHEFPGLADHAAVHQRIYLQLVEMQQLFESGQRELLETDATAIFEGLEEHFIQADRKYGEYFSRQPLAC